jgi:hypothetical protein
MKNPIRWLIDKLFVESATNEAEKFIKEQKISFNLLYERWRVEANRLLRKAKTKNRSEIEVHKKQKEKIKVILI